MFNNDIIIVQGGGEEVCHWWKRGDFFSGLHSDDPVYHLHCSSLPSPSQRHHHDTGVSTEAGNP